MKNGTTPVVVQMEYLGEVTLYQNTDDYKGYQWRYKDCVSEWHQDNTAALDELIYKIKRRYIGGAIRNRDFGNQKQ